MSTSKSSKNDQAYADFLRAEASSAGSMNQKAAQAFLAMFETRLPAAIEPETKITNEMAKDMDVRCVNSSARKAHSHRPGKHVSLAKQVSEKLATYIHTKHLAASFEGLIISFGPLIKAEQEKHIMSVVDTLVSKNVGTPLKTNYRKKPISAVLPKNERF